MVRYFQFMMNYDGLTASPRQNKERHFKFPFQELCLRMRYYYNILFFCVLQYKYWLHYQANAASGMAVSDECKLKFFELKTKRNYRFIIFKIENQEVVVEKLGSPGDSYEEFTDSLPANECRYAVYDFDFTTDENCQKSKIFFVAW